MKTGDELAIDYASNRMAIADLTKRIKELSDFNRPDKGVDLSGVRDEYQENGDHWRGWAHAISNMDDSESLTEDHHLLAALLDTKASRRVEAGKIKRQIYALGRALQVKP